MRKVISAIALILLAAAFTASANSGNPKLFTFGTAVLTGKNSATIHNASGSGEYGGIYAKKMSGKKLSAVKLKFDSTGDVSGGAPRWSIPIDEDNNKITDGYAFMDVNGCGNTHVDTQSASCVVYYKSETFSNWAAFAVAHPTYKTGRKEWNGSRYVDTWPFVIADVPGNYTVSDVIYG